MNKRILVADDDSAILEAISLMLKDEGYNVLTTTNGALVEKMYQKKPDLLLLDIWMSGADGREICRKLKRNKQTKEIPIIIVSANNDTQNIAKGVGADDFIEKPFQMNDLLTKLKKHIRSSSS